MSHVLVVGGTKGIGKVIAQKFEAAGDTVTAMGRSTPLYWPDLAFTSIVFCQRWRSDKPTWTEVDAWEGEIPTSLTITKNLIELYSEINQDKEPLQSVVIMSSIIAHSVADEQGVAYHMAKAALESMARFYAVRLGSRGIRVNCIAPGVTLKPENEDFYKTHTKRVEMYRQNIPIGRMVTAADVANVALFLCSPAAAAITGQTITVDGGVSLLNTESLMRRFLEKGE